jgi:hypothetical protein
VDSLALPFWRELHVGSAVTDKDLLWKILDKAGCEAVCVGVRGLFSWLVVVREGWLVGWLL